MKHPSRISALLIAAAFVVASCDDPKKTSAKKPQEPTGGTAGCTLFFNNMNANAVQNGAVNPQFTLVNSDPSELCALETYHWNGGAGLAPGTIGLLNTTTGVTYGPYAATATPGQNGAPNVNWTVFLNPRVELKPGTYQIIDSSNPSWSFNATSLDKGAPPKASGFAKVWLANTN